jgi:hypothetical protein
MIWYDCSHIRTVVRYFPQYCRHRYGISDDRSESDGSLERALTANLVKTYDRNYS